MIRIVNEAGNNYSAAARVYSVRFPDRRHPNRKVMKKLSDRAEYRGILKSTRTKTNKATTMATTASVANSSNLLGLLKDNMVYQDRQPIEF